jgi:hypothetical protein
MWNGKDNTEKDIFVALFPKKILRNCHMYVGNKTIY